MVRGATDAQKLVWKGPIPLQIRLHDSEVTSLPPPPPVLDPQSIDTKQHPNSANGDITDLAVSSHNTLVASASNDFVIRIWRLPDGIPVSVLQGHRGLEVLLLLSHLIRGLLPVVHTSYCRDVLDFVFESPNTPLRESSSKGAESDRHFERSYSELY